MITESARESPAYRITLFYGPEPVGGESGPLACVFNVKKRSWKAGIQVCVEISTDQLSGLGQELHVGDRLEKCLNTLDPEERPLYQDRIVDLFAQALCWCKLDLQLKVGLTQETQRIPAHAFMTELDRAAHDREESVIAHILEELDLADVPSERS